METPQTRSTCVRDLARTHGFDRCGIAPLGPISRAEYVKQWLAAGMAGTMGYLYRRRESRLDPSKLLPGARSAIVVALNYHQSALPPESGPPRGRVAMYAWGEDYHVVMRDRLAALLAEVRAALQEPFEAEVCVDTSAIIERELAAAAGIGWIGKNTLTLHHELGSYFFIGSILTTLDLMPDAPIADHCGRCTRCLDACPTQAFPAAYQMDARRCISYLTIEHRGEIAPELQPLIGQWVFGCDVCQEVCPFNREAPLTREPRFAPQTPPAAPSLTELCRWDADTYRQAVAGSATERATLAMWQRNAKIAAANSTGGGRT